MDWKGGDKFLAAWNSTGIPQSLKEDTPVADGNANLALPNIRHKL